MKEDVAGHQPKKVKKSKKKATKETKNEGHLWIQVNGYIFLFSVLIFDSQFNRNIIRLGKGH